MDLKLEGTEDNRQCSQTQYAPLSSRAAYLQEHLADPNVWLEEFWF